MLSTIETNPSKPAVNTYAGVMPTSEATDVGDQLRAAQGQGGVDPAEPVPGDLDPGVPGHRHRGGPAGVEVQAHELDGIGPPVHHVLALPRVRAEQQEPHDAVVEVDRLGLGGRHHAERGRVDRGVGHDHEGEDDQQGLDHAPGQATRRARRRTAAHDRASEAGMSSRATS